MSRRSPDELTRPAPALTRRQVVAGACAGFACLAVPAVAGAPMPAAPKTAEHSAAFQAAFRELAGAGEPEVALVKLELPEHAENGNIVPYTLSVESPMSDTDFVRKLHLLSTANPQPRVATFHFTPQSGRAVVSGRMRLAKTQEIIALAELSSGKLVMGTTVVEVELGGCGN